MAGGFRVPGKDERIAELGVITLPVNGAQQVRKILGLGRVLGGKPAGVRQGQFRNVRAQALQIRLYRGQPGFRFTGPELPEQQLGIKVKAPLVGNAHRALKRGRNGLGYQIKRRAFRGRPLERFFV